MTIQVTLIYTEKELAAQEVLRALFVANGIAGQAGARTPEGIGQRIVPAQEEAGARRPNPLGQLEEWAKADGVSFAELRRAIAEVGWIDGAETWKVWADIPAIVVPRLLKARQHLKDYIAAMDKPKAASANESFE